MSTPTISTKSSSSRSTSPHHKSSPPSSTISSMDRTHLYRRASQSHHQESNFVYFADDDDDIEVVEIEKNQNDDDYYAIGDYCINVSDKDDSSDDSDTDSREKNQSSGDGGADNMSIEHVPVSHATAKREKSNSSNKNRAEWATKKAPITIPTSRFSSYYHNRLGYSELPLGIFQFFFSASIMKDIVKYTNKYADSLGHDSLNTNTNEVFAFIGAHIYMSIATLPQLHMYWQEDFKQPFMSSLFSRKRFRVLLSSFNISGSNDEDIIMSPQHHTREFIEHINHVSPRYYHPSQYLTIDESIAAFKGRSDIKVYIPSKPHKFGYKIFVLSSDSYALNLNLAEGDALINTDRNKTSSLVMDMMRPYFNKDHILFCDNYFTSPTLMQHLAQVKTAMCGAVRLNRIGMPTTDQLNKKMLKKMHRGHDLHFQHDNQCLAVWKDASVIVVLYNHILPSTPHTVVQRWGDDGNKFSMFCPQAVQDYFTHARSTDIVNQLRYAYVSGRKAKNAYSRLVWWLIDICIVNSYKLYCIGKKKISMLDFRILLMNEMTLAYMSDRHASQLKEVVSQGVALAKDHYSILSKEDRDCEVCSLRSVKRVRSSYICASCKAHLCIGKCFSAYHGGS
jgi:hypothetical protein